MTSSSHGRIAAAAGGLVLRSLAGRQLLFIEARQAIYELDPLTAEIWRHIEAGCDDQVIIQTLVSGGHDRDDARTRLDALCEIRSGSAPT